jgi:isocitrate lyase
MGVPTVLIARTDANSAQLLTTDADERDTRFIEGNRTPEGFFRIKGGLECAIDRALSYAPYADLLWCETSMPDIGEAREFAQAVHAKFPGKMLAYNCSPSFNWAANLDDTSIGRFQGELGAMGYRFQFITLAGFHNLNYHMFDLARRYSEIGMTAYSKLQQAEFASEAQGYTAPRHHRELGTPYSDAVSNPVSGGQSSTTAMGGSTEHDQFKTGTSD